MNADQFGMNLDFPLYLTTVLPVTSLLMTDNTLVNTLMCVCFPQLSSDGCKKRKEKSKAKEDEGRQQSRVS